MAGRRPWRSVRARTTAGAALVVAIALTAGALAFSAVLSTSTYAASERAAQTRAEELATRIEDGSPALVAQLEDEFVQVLDGDGDVVAASEDAGSGRLLGSGDSGVVQVDDEPVLVVSESLSGGGRLLVGVSVEDDAETMATVAMLLAAGVPLVVLLVAAITWVVVGRALRPVAKIRAEVEGITSAHLDRRVPVPESGDEIAGLATTMNGMLDRLDAAAQAQRRFVSDASHELRSPLAAIRQHAELAQSHPEASSLEELASVVHSEGLRLQGLVDALLLLARLDEGAVAPPEPVDLDDIALAEASRLRRSGFTVDGSGIMAARVQGDPRLLGQLLRNLSDNAARHAAGRIALSVAVVEDAAVITVEDDGAGVPVAERERVFERFVRLDEARARDAGGSGLGLAIVRAIARASGGGVRVDDSRWGGARFAVRLPAST